MEERLSRWGIGPRMAVSALAYAALAELATRLFPRVCVVEALKDTVVVEVAAAMLAAGVPMWLAGAVAAMRAYRRDQLATSGMFAIVRHPIYSAWITLLLPGLALLTASWPFLLTPLVAYAVFKRLIYREDVYLAKRYGEAYFDYRRRVNEIIPVPRFW